jgi:superfamily II DNA helicase RecQ
MQIKVFTIPISDNGSAQIELNHFLSGNKILEIEQFFYQNDKGAVWCFCVRFLNTSTNIFSPMQTKKIDYKEVLNENQFVVFSKLREIRKSIAAKDAVPAYAVFTDVELAEISKLDTISENNVLQIKGIAEKRMTKYGKHLIENYLNHKFNETSQ